MISPHETNGAPKATTPPAPPSPPSAFAAAVLKIGGQVHRLPDGAGGHYEIAILNPGALRPKHEGGRN